MRSLRSLRCCWTSPRISSRGQADSRQLERSCRICGASPWLIRTRSTRPCTDCGGAWESRRTRTSWLPGAATGTACFPKPLDPSERSSRRRRETGRRGARGDRSAAIQAEIEETPRRRKIRYQPGTRIRRCHGSEPRSGPPIHRRSLRRRRSGSPPTTRTRAAERQPRIRCGLPTSPRT